MDFSRVFLDLISTNNKEWLKRKRTLTTNFSSAVTNTIFLNYAHIFYFKSRSIGERENKDKKSIHLLVYFQMSSTTRLGKANASSQGFNPGLQQWRQRLSYLSYQRMPPRTYIIRNLELLVKSGTRILQRCGHPNLNLLSNVFKKRNSWSDVSPKNKFFISLDFVC